MIPPCPHLEIVEIKREKKEKRGSVYASRSGRFALGMRGSQLGIQEEFFVNCVVGM